MFSNDNLFIQNDSDIRQNSILQVLIETETQYLVEKI